MPELEMPLGGYNLMNRGVSEQKLSQGVRIDFQSDIKRPNVDNTETIFDGT
jgi:hypothetical protein